MADIVGRERDAALIGLQTTVFEVFTALSRYTAEVAKPSCG